MSPPDLLADARRESVRRAFLAHSDAMADLGTLGSGERYTIDINKSRVKWSGGSTDAVGSAVRRTFCAHPRNGSTDGFDRVCKREGGRIRNGRHG
jgi:hypothetical protein